MKTILKWNDETLTMSVACPAVKDDEVVENLKHLSGCPKPERSKREG